MITKDTLIADLLKQEKAEEIADVLFSHGMHCLGCAVAHMETIEEAVGVHGLDLDQLLDEINAIIAG